MERAGLQIIKEYEGCRLKAYLCPAQKWTIGYGRTTNVHSGDTSSQDQDDHWLIEEYDAFEAAIRKLLGTAKTTDNQLGAMVALAYNIRLTSFRSSTVLRCHLAGRYSAATQAFGLWVKATVKGMRITLPGLVWRRAAEARLYATLPASTAALHAYA